MGLKHLMAIEREFRENQEKEFTQSWFTNNANIDYNEALMCLQYLWENKTIVLLPNGKYRLKSEDKI